jgi:vacuolar-type H+-ATPase subunit I/STV1
VLSRRRDNGSVAPTVARLAARGAGLLVGGLAASYVLAVAAWLWSLRYGISGPHVSTGVMLVGVAILLAWLAGVVAAGSHRAGAHDRRRTWVELGVAVQ